MKTSNQNQSTLDKVLLKLNDIEHKIKVLDVKTDDAHKEAAKIRTEFEERFDKLEHTITSSEKRLHFRIQEVGNQITNHFQKKFDNHDKRIKKLEHQITA